MVARHVFITGGTGYLGRHLIPELLARGHTVRALVRDGSQNRLPAGAQPVIGNALDASTFASYIAPSDTFVHLVGVSNPSPTKAKEFKEIDLVSIRESVRALSGSPIRHFIYLSAPYPAPVMKAYLAVRAEGEQMIRATNIAATFVRPWYVIGPGHRWVYAALPFYWLVGAFPPTRELAQRLYPVKLEQIVRALADAVENPTRGVRIIEGPEMRRRPASTPSRSSVRA